MVKGRVRSWFVLGVFEPDFDETDMFTEAGILVFDMGG